MKRHKRKAAQMNRDAQATKRLAKVQARRSKRSLPIDVTEREVAQPEPATIPEVAHPDAPASWGCVMAQAAIGKFVVLEVNYDKPKRRGISVGQVLLAFLCSFNNHAC